MFRRIALTPRFRAAICFVSLIAPSLSLGTARAETHVTEASPALLRHRARALRSILRPLAPSFENWADAFSLSLNDLDRLIVGDWIAADRVARAAVTVDVARLDQLNAAYELARADANEKGLTSVRRLHSRAFNASVVVFPEAVEALRAQAMEMQDRVRARVREWPWSTYDWATVWADRVAAAEITLAAHLGVDLAHVWALTEHAAKPIDGVLNALARPDFDPPLYSTATIEALASALDRVLAPLGRRVREVNGNLERERDAVKTRAVAAASDDRGSYRPIGTWPLRFHFEQVNADVPNVAELGPLYDALRERLGLMLARAEQLTPSPVRDLARAEIAAALGELAVEHRTLAPRLEALRSGELRYLRKFSGPDRDDALTWDRFDACASALGAIQPTPDESA